MISPFQVYLVLKLDDIITGAQVLACSFTLVLGLICLMATSINAMEADSSYTGDPKRDRLVAASKYWRGKLYWCLGGGAFFFSVATLLPTTKQAAAILILPAITSDEVVAPVKKEAGDLYALAKQALTNAVEADKPKKQEVEDVPAN